MMEYQIQVPLGSLPVNLVLIGNRTYGRLAFVKVRHIGPTIFDLEKDGHSIRAVFEQDSFTIFSTTGDEEVFEYDTIYDYKNIPAMLEWLKEQNLQEPNGIFG